MLQSNSSRLMLRARRRRQSQGTQESKRNNGTSGANDEEMKKEQEGDSSVDAAVLLEPFGKRLSDDDDDNGCRYVNKIKDIRYESNNNNKCSKTLPPSLEPYVSKLERFELFSTNQCYYLVACDKDNTAYRVLKMDRTLIEHYNDEMYSSNEDGGKKGVAVGTSSSSSSMGGVTGGDNNSYVNNNIEASAQANEASHNPKPSLRPLSEFLTEDPNVYTQDEIQSMLDMIHHGNRLMTKSNKGTVGGDTSNADNVRGGGLKPIAKAYGIVGLIRFLDCYYLTLITRRAKVGSIGGNAIYTIKGTETFPIKPAESINSPQDIMGGYGYGYGDGFVGGLGAAVGAAGGIESVMSGGEGKHMVDTPTDPSAMLLNMWNRGKRSVGLGLTNREIAELRYQGLYQVVDLTKNFYFSYTYDLTRSLQDNFLTTVSQPYPPPPIKDMYAWNFFLTRELELCTNTTTSYHWVLPIIHGAFVQRKLSDYGRSLNLILLARRSRHFAGTRYLKRGVSDMGMVANDVEHEQIVHDESSSIPSAGGVFSSFLQVRGSIPTFWTQESSVTMPKPPIELNRIDPTYNATRLHFEDLLKRYNSPIVVLDLVKQSEKREREVRVGDEFRHAIDHINTSIDDKHKIRYCALDYSHISKHRNLDVSTSLNEVSTWSVNQTGFFCSAPRWKIVAGGHIVPFDYDETSNKSLKEMGVPSFPMEQKGVLRTNCIDCLDRTNVAQFSAGVEALEQQLVVMGIRSSAALDPSSTIIRVLIDMYVEIGDFIALQYGGSEAHKKVTADRSENISAGPVIGKHKELLTSIRRYYSNAFTDRLKQDAMNLFLGYYIPCRHAVPLWEMESDYYLHNFHVKEGKGTVHSMKSYQRAFGIEWESDEGTSEQAGRSMNQTGLDNGQDDGSSYESFRISRVRRRCDAQNKALSLWWKAAIQYNIEQRMWMQIGRNQSESMLKPRYERHYAPEKLAQFDRFFARDFDTPIRRSHSAQHGENSDAENELSEYRRSLSARAMTRDEKQISDDDISQTINEKTTTIYDFAETYGFEPRIAPSLKRFLKPHEVKTTGQSNKSNSEDEMKEQQRSDARPNFIGTLRHDKEPCSEYLRYASSSTSFDPLSKPYRKKAFDEFTFSLHDTTLHHDDVDGIRKLAESAHISRTIRAGPFRGLSQSESAVEVTTVIQEQFNVLGNMRSRGELMGGFPLVDSELKRRGVNKAGVTEAVAAGWERIANAEQQYSEVINTSRLGGCRRSDLTSDKSMSLYFSFFDEATGLSQPETTYILGEKSPTGPANIRKKVHLKESSTVAKASHFVKDAAKAGISISCHSDVESPTLFSFDRRRNVPAGFEQINEDLFARKDNKFMVFNGAGVDSWDGHPSTEPVTKILAGIEEDIIHTPV